jgi:AcrR family transcriptional regulator
MGRPSLAAERVATILDATGRCVARFGVEGTTLEKVAAESGMSRSHIRHYVGNRADLIDRFRARILERYLPPAPTIAADLGLSATELVLHLLFDGEAEADLDDYAAIDGVLAASRHDAALQAEVRTVYARIETFIAQAVTLDHPDWEPSKVAAIASQVLQLSYGYATMHAIGLPSSRLPAARDLARALLDPPGAPGQ